MVRAEQVSEGSVGVGTTFRAVLRSLGRTSEMETQFVEFERPTRLTSVTRAAWAEIRGTLTFEPVPDGTRMTWAWNVAPRGLARLAGPLVAVVGRRQERAIWRGLKRLLEGAE